MIRFALTAALALALGGAALGQETPWQMPRAEEPPTGDPRPYGLPESEPGLLDNFLSDFVSRAQPHLEGLARDMSGLMSDYEPVFEEFTSLVDDIRNYELPPERLPNGDIILRRKAEAPPPPPVDELNRLLPQPEAPEPPTPVPQTGPQIEL